MQFVVHGEWSSGTAPPEEVQAGLAAALRPGDESVAVWISPEDPQVLMVGFDVEADSYEAALDAGRTELLEAGRATPGSSLARVTAMTEDGYRTWSP